MITDYMVNLLQINYFLSFIKTSTSLVVIYFLIYLECLHNDKHRRLRMKSIEYM